MEQRHRRLPALPEDRNERGRREDLGPALLRPPEPHAVTAWRPAQDRSAEDHMRLAAMKDERAVGKLLERRGVTALRARVRRETLAMQARVDGVRVLLPGMEVCPDLDKTSVVLAAAERARPVAGRERRRLVEEEELGEAARLHQWVPVPAPERKPACDPALPVVTPADSAPIVVEAAAVPVDEPTRRVGDHLAQRCDAVLESHLACEQECRIDRAVAVAQLE